jgi:signal recognition particle subunit SEC65
MENQTKKRCDQLFKLGLTFNGKYYRKDDINVHWTEIITETNKDWNKIISKIEAEIKRRKEKA